MNAVREKEMNYQPTTAGVSHNGAALMGNNDNSPGLVQSQPQNNQSMSIQANVADDAAVSFCADILFGGGIASVLGMATNGLQAYDDFQKEQIKVSFSRSELDKKPSLSEVNASSVYQITPDHTEKRNKLIF